MIFKVRAAKGGANEFRRLAMYHRNKNMFNEQANQYTTTRLNNLHNNLRKKLNREKSRVKASSRYPFHMRNANYWKNYGRPNAQTKFRNWYANSKTKFNNGTLNLAQAKQNFLTRLETLLENHYNKEANRLIRKYNAA